MIYYIIDMRYPRAFRQTQFLPGTWKKDQLHHLVYPNQSIKTIVRDTRRYIIEAKQGYGSVETIRLCGHGNSGYLEIGEGLTESNVDAFREIAAFMKPDFYNVGVEIFGCGVGSDSSVTAPELRNGQPVCVSGSTQNGGHGFRLLQKLAKAVNRNVKAGLDCQYATGDWKFQGLTITVKPDGNSWLRDR